MGIKYKVYLDNDYHDGIYACSRCQSPLSTTNLLESKDFRGSHGKAYLFKEVVNIKESKHTEERMMTTGKHCITYISCMDCGEELGWKYIKAYEHSQKYKEGKFILETCSISLMRDTSTTTAASNAIVMFH
ncbi:unnamed protein product [Mucor hiemalis]